MAIFGADHDPSPTERLREGALWLLLLAFGAGFVGLTTWLNVIGKPPIEIWLVPSSVLLVLILANRPPFNAWLEYGRRTTPGQWRTTRVTRILVVCWALFFGAYAASMSFQVWRSWVQGDMQRFAGALIGAVVLATLSLGLALRRSRDQLEFSVDEAGVFSAEWGGVVPWNAIDFIIAARMENDSLRFVLKLEALARLPDFVRRRNGSLDLNLGATSLSASAALAALKTARPGLEIRRSRSAGLAPSGARSD